MMMKETWQPLIGLEDEIEVKEEYIDCFSFNFKDFVLF